MINNNERRNLENESKKLEEMANHCFKNEDYEGALTHFLSLLENEKLLLEPDDDGIRGSHFNIGFILLKMKRYKEAIVHFTLALEILEKRSNPSNPDVIDYHSILGNCYMNIEQNEDALIHFQIMLDARETYLPDNLSEIVEAHYKVGTIHYNLGQYEDAQRHIKRALEIQEKILPLDSLEIAGYNRAVGNTYRQMGKFEEALCYYKHSLEIFEELNPLNHHELAQSLGCVAIAYDELGRHSDALQLNLQALEMMSEALPTNHIDIASLHGNVAKNYHEMGQYENAIWHLNEALVIRQNSLGTGHPDIAMTHQSIGTAYGALGHLGMFDNALHHLNIASEIMESFPGHPYAAMVHNSLGVIYGELEQYEKSLHHLEIALEIRENTLPENHPDISQSHNNLGQIKLLLYMYDDALQHGMRAIEIMEKTLPTDHPGVVITHSNIGVILSEMGRYKEALKHHATALDVMENIFPSEHPRIAITYTNIGCTYYEQGKYEKAAEMALQLMKRLPEIYRNIMATYSESIRASLLQSMNENLSFIYTVVKISQHMFSAEALYNMLLHTKNIGAEAEFLTRASGLERYRDYKEELDMLKMLIEDRNVLMLNNFAQKNLIAEKNREIQKIELKLSPFIREIDFKLHMANMTSETVFENLPLNHALIEYGWFFYSETPDDTALGIKSGGRYCVFVLVNKKITVKFLESDNNIHTKLYSLREKMKLKSDAESEMTELFQLLFEPIAEFFHDIEHIYIAPDSELYKLPFELLLDKEGKTLSDKFSISYLSTGRDIVRSKIWNTSDTDYHSVAILADPMYDLPDNTVINTDDDSKTSDIRGFTQSRDSGKLALFSPLPFGRAEADILDKHFDGEKHRYYELDARKSVLSEIVAPNIIHIVTHGFAHEQQEFLSHQRKFVQLQTHTTAEDPLVRCGLAFSGANTWLKSDKQKRLDEYGDGILNAKEVLSLNLHGTNLLVLSACQTALGEVKNGEGIHGLRRSFELVGVQTILCTLWDVSDIAGAILMERFYKNLLNDGKSKLASLINAKDYIRNMTCRDLISWSEKMAPNLTEELLHDVTENNFSLDEKIFSHPFFWAGYILQGGIN